MQTGTLVDFVLAVLAVEAMGLAIAGRRFARLPPWPLLLPNLAAGLFLVLALRFAVHASGWEPVAACLALAGVAHLVDLVGRVRDRSRSGLPGD